MSTFYLLASTTTTRITTSWPWYLTRASGLVAAGLLILLMITGISMFTGYQFKIMEPLKSWTNHRTLGIAFSIAASVHVLSLLFDKYITFTIVQVFVPFTSQYKHVHIGSIGIGSFGVALGVISMYLVVAIVITSINRIMTKRQTVWRWTHYLSYLVIGFIFLHSIMIGTDLKNGLWRWVWVGLNVVILGFIGLRLRRTGSLSD